MSTPPPEELYNWGEIKPAMEASVLIRGCYGDPVELEFACYKPETFEKRIEKLDTLIEDLDNMRAAMHTIWDAHLIDIATKNEQNRLAELAIEAGRE